MAECRDATICSMIIILLNDAEIRKHSKLYISPINRPAVIVCVAAFMLQRMHPFSVFFCFVEKLDKCISKTKCRFVSDIATCCIGGLEVCRLPVRPVSQEKGAQSRTLSERSPLRGKALGRERAPRTCHG